MKLVEAGQNLNHVLIFELFDANWTLADHEITVIGLPTAWISDNSSFILIFGLRWFWLIKICRQLIHYRTDPLCMLCIIILIKRCERIVVHAIEFSGGAHWLKLEHLEISSQQEQLAADFAIAVHPVDSALIQSVQYWFEHLGSQAISQSFLSHPSHFIHCQSCIKSKADTRNLRWGRLSPRPHFGHLNGVIDPHKFSGSLRSPSTPWE